MTPLTITHALGWTLLHFCWQGALVALILACIRSLLSGRSAQPRYLAACCALLLMVALPIVTFIRLITERAPVHTTFSLTINAAITNPIIPTPQLSLLERVAATLDHAMPTLLTLWLGGVLLLLARLTIGLIITRRMKSATTQPPPPALLHTFRQLSHRIGVSRPVRLLNSALVQVPTVIGWLRPVVLIPVACLAGLSSAQVEAVLAHELAHIRRHDYLISVLQSIVEAVLFYHPAVWWISQQIRREREHCCDDLAVTITGDPLTYARALSLLEEHRSTLPAIALGANGGILTMRIKRLLTPTQNPTSQLAALTLLGLVIATTAIGITTAAHAQKTPAPNNIAILTEDLRGPEPAANIASTKHSAQQPATSTPQNLPSEYKAWLDQDVRWIITPEERNTFLHLTTNDQRDTFIQQFWTSRNAIASNYREEHYHRIAYANQRFTASNIPGWATDRGHILIVNGLPSTVDSHPAAAPGSYPYEVWSYTTTSAGQTTQFKFVDTCSCGNYQLQSQTGSTQTPLASNYSTVYDKQLYDNGMYLFLHGEYEAARRQLQTLVDQYPDSRFRAPARQTIVETIQKQSTHATARSLAKPTLHPASYNPFAAPSQSPSPNGPARVSAAVMAGSKIFSINPIYPPEAKANHIQGAVIIGVTIAKDGAIQSIDTVTGPEMLRDSALEAVRQWRYKPYLLNGEPTEVQSAITVNYHLASPEEEEQQDATITPKKIGGSVSAPHVVSQVAPDYTAEAREKKISGRVLVHLWVDEQGNPSHIRITRSLDEGLDQKAIEAIKKYKFTPAMEDGRPVLVELNIEVNFQLF